MGREEENVGFEDIKQYALPDYRLGEVDITERVMTRITAVNAGGRLRSFKPVPRFLVFVMSLFSILIASASVYAVSEYIEIRNRAGELKIQFHVKETEAPAIQLVPTGNPGRKPTYRDRVLEIIQPGQVLAYYVKGDRQNPAIQYVHHTFIYSTYNEFKELMVRTSAPVIKEPTNLPVGFKFTQGSVMPNIPMKYYDQKSEEYSRLQELFQKRAEAEPEQDLFVEQVPWTEAKMSELYYEGYSEKGNIQFRIHAAKGMIMAESTLTADDHYEKINIDGIEVIYWSRSQDYIFDNKEVQRDYFYAVWYDERQDTHFSMSTSGTGKLTEKQFKRIVENMVEG